MAAAMGGAYSIQSFFIPVLKKNKNQNKYVFYTLLAYIFGGSAYLYIAYMGSIGTLTVIQVFGIVNLWVMILLKKLCRDILEMVLGK